MATKDLKSKIIDAYIDYVLTEGHKPASVYAFAKANKMKEGDFYNYFSSFEALESGIWMEDFQATLKQIKDQDVWAGYSIREKLLSFFYTYVENLKGKRSFVVHSLKGMGKPKPGLVPPSLKGLKSAFEDFATEMIAEGLESSEIKDRKKLNNRYKDAMWLQFMFILNFWSEDSSQGFEKTDEAIEKGVNVTFDLISRNPIDNLIDYGKFLAQNSMRM